MDINIAKQNLLKLLAKVDYDPSESSAIKDFIESYDGNNHNEFLVVMIQYITTLMYLQKMELKAKAYDELDSGNKDFSSAMKSLKVDFERLNANKDLIQAANKNS